MIELKYRTFDELMTAVKDDFEDYNAEGFIQPSKLIKIAQKINKEFTVRINEDKEKILTLEKGRVKLPSNFYLLNFAMLCGEYTINHRIPHGRHTEDRLVPVDEYFTDPLHTHLIDCENAYQVVETFEFQTRTYKTFAPINIINSKNLSSHCPNTHVNAEAEGYVEKGWFYATVDSAKLYINYAGTMEDDDMNLLVLDHDEINEYYEYAIKCRILENMLIKGEPVGELLKLMEGRRRTARITALSYQTPDFKEIQDLHAANRKRMHRKYFSIFQ